jgi:hypothetical protein
MSTSYLHKMAFAVVAYLVLITHLRLIKCEYGPQIIKRSKKEKKAVDLIEFYQKNQFLGESGQWRRNVKHTMETIICRYFNDLLTCLM